MSISLHVIGLRPPTEDYKKKLAAYQACAAAGVDPPKALLEYFDHTDVKYVEPNGMKVDLYNHPAVKRLSNGDVEIEIEKLPQGVTILRAELS